MAIIPSGAQEEMGTHNPEEAGETYFKDNLTVGAEPGLWMISTSVS